MNAAHWSLLLACACNPVALGVDRLASWQACQPRSIFVVRIDNGTPKAVRGVVTRAFLGAVADSCHHHGVVRGAVMGKAHGRQIAPRVQGRLPRRVPSAVAQRLGQHRMVGTARQTPARRWTGPGLTGPLHQAALVIRRKDRHDPLFPFNLRAMNAGRAASRLWAWSRSHLGR